MAEFIQQHDITPITFKDAGEFERGRERLKHLWDQPPSPLQRAEIELLAVAMVHWEATQGSSLEDADK